MDKRITQQMEGLLLSCDTQELDELIQCIENEKEERKAHDLQNELEVQDYITLHDCSEEN